MSTETNNTTRIGIIGIGAMGFAMATNLHQRGRRPHVRDIDPAAVAAAAALGIPACDSPAALALRSKGETRSRLPRRSRRYPPWP